jgi:hypothetical protein
MSAGIYPKGLNPLAVEAMREIGSTFLVSNRKML